MNIQFYNLGTVNKNKVLIENKNERGKSLFVIHKKKEKSINSSRTPTKLEYGHSLYKGESQTINV